MSSMVDAKDVVLAGISRIPSRVPNAQLTARLEGVKLSDDDGVMLSRDPATGQSRQSVAHVAASQ
jgi:hypothetical protein